MNMNKEDLLFEFKQNIKFDYNLKKKNWFNIGGNTKIYYKADNLKELIKFLKIIDNKEKIFVLGGGSNTLITDKTFDGVVIKLSNNFNNISLLSEDLIIISAKLRGSLDKKEKIEKKQNDLVQRKKLSQPSQIKTCGSTFKNISKDKKAWMLIKEAGCENFKEGDAKISQKHCNFFINNGNAKSDDIENLIKKVQEKVYEKTGINLELEIKIVGE